MLALNNGLIACIRCIWQLLLSLLFDISGIIPVCTVCAEHILIRATELGEREPVKELVRWEHWFWVVIVASNVSYFPSTFDRLFKTGHHTEGSKSYVCKKKVGVEIKILTASWVFQESFEFDTKT